MSRAFLLFLLFAQIPLALAVEEKECGSVRLDQGSGPFAQMPVYDQRAFADEDTTDTNICFAIAGSQIIDAERFRLLGRMPDQLSSPLALALREKHSSLAWNDIELLPQNKPELLLGGGLLTNTINKSRGAPVCDQNWLDKFDGSFSSESSGPSEIRGLYPSKKNFLRAVLREVENYQAVPLPFLAGLFGRKPPEITEPFFECRVAENTIPLKGILEAIQAGANFGGPLSQLNGFFGAFCRGHTFVPKIPEAQELLRPRITGSSRGDLADIRNAALEQKFHALLGGGRPVGVGFCAVALEQKGKGELLDMPSGQVQKSCVVHAALVVGRRFHEGACQVLVRNSYGPSCKKADGSPKYDWDCENGSVWIDSEQLARSTLQLSWL